MNQMNQGQQLLEAKMQIMMQQRMWRDCFKDCVNNFSSAELAAGEKSCLTNCGTRSKQTEELWMKIAD